MIHRTAHFIAKQEKLEEAIEAIKIFTTAVNSKESGCQLYRSLQSNANHREFLHYMIFETSEDEEIHRNTNHVKEFVDKLYPLLEQNPEFTSYSHVVG